MDDLLKKYTEYMRLENCRAEYLLANGQTIDAIYKEENFAHLLGLHKLIDIQIIQFWQDKSNKKVKLSNVLRQIKNSTLTDTMVKASSFYPKIQDRYESFSYDNLTTLNYTDAIINFNPSLMNSKIKSDYLLFEEKKPNQYNHLAIALDKKTGTRYFETFFHEPTNNYLTGQLVVPIKQFTLFDSKNNVIVTDSF